MSNSKPKVCVGIACFNQARYIRQTLDSVLAQETNFWVETVVHDDASTDGTAEIVADYAAAHLGRIRAVLQPENQFSQGRKIMALLVAEMRGRAEYLAFLDGDDFWQDPRKLQVQADFLDADPGVALCQTRTRIWSERRGHAIGTMPPLHARRARMRLGNLAHGNFVQTSAVMLRDAAVPDLHDDFHTLAFGDLPFFALVAETGRIANLPRTMASYRVHDSNRWVSRSRSDRIEATRGVMAFLAETLRPKNRAPFIAAARHPNAQLPRPLRDRILAMIDGANEPISLVTRRPLW